MPTYEYQCPENGQTISVFHGINIKLETWGEVCELASIEVGNTSYNEPVNRLIGTGSLLLKSPGEQDQPASGGCCGPNSCKDQNCV